MTSTEKRPETLFEAASYDLNKFRERRMAERRAVPRGTADRRSSINGQSPPQPDDKQDEDGKQDGKSPP
jgi:hypothetical protein